MNDLVSIIITTRNREDLLPRALNSVINQTYKDIEIIIIDDCSTDKTQEVIKNYQELYSNIIYIKNNIPSGANVSRNKGIKIAKGKFIAGLDDDDEFMPNRIELLLKNYDEKYAFITSLNIIQSDYELRYSQAPEVVTIEHMKQDNILMNQAFIEKDRLIKIGLYDINLTAYQDYDMWVRLILQYGNVKVLQIFTQKVYFQNNRKRITNDMNKRFKGYFSFYKKHKKLFSKTEKKNFLSVFYFIRKKKLSINTFLILRTDKHENTLLQLLNTEKFQYLIIQNLFNSLSQLTEKYVLYGYGNVGKLIFPIIKNNIVAIIDKSLEKNTFINDIPVIDIKQIKHYSKNIILTPIPYKNDILEELKDIDCTIINIFK